MDRHISKSICCFYLIQKKCYRDHVIDVEDPFEIRGEIQRQWDKIKDIEKKIFLLNTAISEREREYCICRKHFNQNDPSSPMVACNICNEWYHVECVRFFYPFVVAVPFFVSSNCVDKHSQFFYRT